MTHVIKMNTSDIQKIIADKYGVGTDSVYVTCNKELEGYGVNETEVYRPTAIVTIKE